MPKTQKYVEINHEGEWLHAFVIDETLGGDNFRLEYWIGSDRQVVTAKPGIEHGFWREPQ